MKLQDIARDPSKSEQGIWWDYETQGQVDAPHATHFCVRIAERDNPGFRDAHERLRLGAAKRLGPNPDEDVALEALQQVRLESMAYGILMDWANLEGPDGQPVAHTPEAALEVLRDSSLWHLRQFIEDASGAVAGYMTRVVEEVSGN